MTSWLAVTLTSWRRRWATCPSIACARATTSWHAALGRLRDDVVGELLRVARGWLSSWFGFNVDLEIHFVGLEEAYDEIETCGFSVDAAMVREPMLKGELPTRRCYLLARRV